MRRIGFITITVFVLVVILIGCSGGNQNPLVIDITQVNPASDSPLKEMESGRSFLGSWYVEFDLVEMNAEIQPDRDLCAHFNLTEMIPAPGITINSYDPLTQVVDVDIKINNPYTVSGYDLRLIIYTDSAGHKLLNSDGWTGLYDIAQGLPINPFKAYGKDNTNRTFPANTALTENLQIYLPGGNPNVLIAIDGSYPSNCTEPYSIDNFMHLDLYDTPGSTARAYVEVLDWQNDVDSVYLHCPAITDQNLVPFELYNIWECDIINQNRVTAGDYPGVIIAYSDSIPLYDFVTINVQQAVQSRFEWARTWGGTGFDEGKSIAIDSTGNIYVAGNYSEVVDFDTGLTTEERISNGLRDVFYCSFDEFGEFNSVQTWGGTGNDHCEAITTDIVGNVYVTGDFKGEVDFDPGPGTVLKTSTYNTALDEWSADVFVSKFNSSGNLLWVSTWGGIYNDYGQDIAVDFSGNVYVVGGFSDTVDFNPGAGTYNRTSNGSSDAYLNVLTSTGARLWTNCWGGLESDNCQKVYIDYTNSIIATGYYRDEVDMDPGTGTENHFSNGYEDIFLSKFTNAGAFQWCNTWGGVWGDYSYGLVADGDANVFVAGSFIGTVDFDPGIGLDELIETGSGTVGDPFLSKYNSSGDYLWARNWGSINTEWATGVTADSTGDVYVTGYFKTTADFDPGPGEDERISVNYSDDVFISKFDNSGNYGWVYTFGGPSGDVGRDLVTIYNAELYTTGEFSDTVDFEEGTGSDLHVSNGFRDTYLLKISIE